MTRRRFAPAARSGFPAIALCALWAAVVPGKASAETKPLSPHIDSIREELKESDAQGDSPPAESGSYSESLKQKILKKDAEDPDQAPSSRSYTQELQEELKGEPGAENDKSAGYSDQVRSTLETKETGGAIQAVMEGRSELKTNLRFGQIHHAAGLRIGASVTRELTASAELGGANFSDIYGSGYTPDVTFFYEYQPWHSEWLGSLGLVTSLGLSYNKGTGRFKVPLTKPTGEAFPEVSRVSSQLFSIPVVVGLSYRFNLLRYLRPFVMAGPSLVGFYELRSDNKKSHYATSRAIYFSGGVSVLLDWMSKNSSWDLYKEHGIHHYYLTVEYNRLSSFSGGVSYAAQGVFGGLTFEF